MTSGNLQRWILPFSWNLNMKEDCETYRGTWNAGVEYYSICISLEFGSLNNVVGNIKSSIGFCALIWIVKATLALNTIQQRNMDITHPKHWSFSMYICILLWKISAEFSHFFQNEETAFASGKNTCTMNEMCESVLYTCCMYNEHNIKKLFLGYMHHNFIMQM